MAFTQLGLSDQLVQGILATGYTAPTEIQARAIPLALAGNDLMGLAQTGTGKTAAFVLPLLHRLTLDPAYPDTASQETQHNTASSKRDNYRDTPRESRRAVRALVLTPTRELAVQVEDSVKKYGRFLPFHSLAVFGGVSMDHQLRSLRRGVDIIIATPGRLLDLLNRQAIDLSRIEMLVLDEADRMFDMGFINDVRKIVSNAPATRQTLLFSATMSREIKALANSIQRNPQLVEVGERKKPGSESITQYFYSVPQDHKLALLIHILETVEMDSVLIFSRTKHGADKIQHKLERKGITAVAIHSNRTQSQRQRALDGFRKRHFKVLVATDIAARGIDVEGISHVINFDTPAFAEDYVHRIGRTGRASATGDAITLVSREEQGYLRRISQYINKRCDTKPYDGFNYAEAAASQAAAEKLHAEKSGQSYSSHSGDSSGSSGSGRKPRYGSGGGGQREKSYGAKSYNDNPYGDKHRTYNSSDKSGSGTSNASGAPKFGSEKPRFGNRRTGNSYGSGNGGSSNSSGSNGSSGNGGQSSGGQYGNSGGTGGDQSKPFRGKRRSTFSPKRKPRS